jgi:methylmalonyl-CoA mutase N-terminal domain/subunit
MEAEANRYINEIDDMGGVVAGINKGYFRRQIAEASYRFSQEMEAGDRIIVGVNAYTDSNEEKRSVDILRDPALGRDRSVRAAERFKKRRDQDDGVSKAPSTKSARPPRTMQNVMPALIDGALANCTLGEMVQAMADIYGRYTGGPEW